jgi:hypothetical protein
MGAAKRKVADWAAQEGGLNDATAAVSAVAHEVVHSTVEATEGIAQKSAEVLKDFGGRVQQAAPVLREGARAAVDHVASMPSEERDRYLLGAAGLALAAAVGIAANRA